MFSGNPEPESQFSMVGNDVLRNSSFDQSLPDGDGEMHRGGITPPRMRVLARISHHPTVEARHMAAMTSLRLLAVLNVLFKYACARQAARASS